MNNRPRCRDFVPLITNQLRVRNLVQLKACNLQCNQKSQVYFTLHSTSMSSPIYTSERMEVQSNSVEWPEIMSELLIRSAARSVCIRVWQHCDSSLSKNSITKKDNSSANSDKILFMWGVYFSGLVLIPKRSNIRLRKNTLVFCMNGGSFTSADYILTDDSCDSISKSIPNCDYPSSLSSISNSSQSVVSSGSIGSSNGSEQDSHRCITEIMEESRYFKVRYVELSFPNCEIRPSYNVEKLLELQQRQRDLKRRKNESDILIDRICRKSAYCLNLELIANKPFFYEPPKRTSMGRTLDRLLSEQQAPPKPEVLLKAQELRRKIEYAKFRCRFLQVERERKRLQIRELEVKRDKLKDENIEMDSFFLNGYHKMRKERDKLVQDEKGSRNQEETLKNLVLALQETRRNILRELNDIYRINREEDGRFTINGIYLPVAERYTSADSSNDISVALGYVAHAVIICSRILNVPLRNAIRHEGSRSKIVDNVISPTERVFPLNTRASPPGTDVMYGIYLVNQNIAQLKFISSIRWNDARATLSNLWDLINKIQVVDRKIPREHKRIEGSHTDDASRASSMEISLPDPPNLDIEFNLKRSFSKSLDNMDEEIEKDIAISRKFISEPILDLQQRRDKNLGNFQIFKENSEKF